ncbi:MAG: hypothetical protein IIA45_15780 [Bacteroidetes bacterium]|nr:hypothetical protein [Bacteroidota bacterium]
MYVKEYEHATLIKFQQSNTFLVETKPNYTGQSKKGIILQDDIQKMLESYGKPDEIRVSGNTYSYIYKHDHIIFKSNNNKITSWLVFYKF